MKTLLTNIKSVLQNNATLALYIKDIQIVSPATIPDKASSLVPCIGIAPVSSPESWKSNTKKEVTHTVELYVINWLQVQESAIIGVGSQKGILDVVSDVSSAVRANTFSSYLSAPADIAGVSYTTAGYGDNFYLIVATITLYCRRIF